MTVASLAHPDSDFLLSVHMSVIFSLSASLSSFNTPWSPS